MSHDIERLFRPELATMQPYLPIHPFEVVSQRLGRAPQDIVKLDANENPYGPSPRAVEAMAGYPWLHIYPDPQSTELRAALAEYTGVPAERILAGHGADELIDLLGRLVLSPGDAVIDCPPTFGMYAFCAAVNGACLINVPRRADFSIDVDAIERIVAPEPASGYDDFSWLDAVTVDCGEGSRSGHARPKLLFLCSPNNPDGGLLAAADLERLLRLPLLVVVDEAYIEFSRPGASFIDWVADHPNLVVLRTFSKWAGLGGLRVGYGVFQPAIIEHLWKIKQPYNVNVAGNRAAITSLAVESLPQEYVLALADQSGLAWLRAGGYRVEVLDASVGDARYLMVDLTGALADRERPGQEIYNDGVRAVRRLTGGQTLQLDKGAWLLDQPLHWVEREPLRLPDSVTPIAQVQQVIDQVNLPRLMAYTNELSGEVPVTIMGQPFTIVTRYSPGSPPPQASIMASTYMVERLARLGLAVSTHTWNASRPPNVIAEKPGLDPSAGIIIICAHLDSTSGSPSTLAPGADDNASGSVAVLMAAELLSHYNFDATLRFALFTGEEQGLYGSAAYAAMVQSQDIRGVLNMDMIAWDFSGGPDMDVHARSSVPGNIDLGNLYADVVSAYELPLTPVVYGNGTGASDHASFWTYNIPAILAIENYNADVGAPRDFNAYYHTINDRAQYFNQNYFLAMTQASLATFVHMGGLRTTCYWADVNCSGQVDTMDLARAAAAWQTQSGQWNYSLVYDLDSSGAVDVVDIQSFAAQWGWDGS